MPVGDMRTRLAPQPCKLETPSTNKVHCGPVGSVVWSLSVPGYAEVGASSNGPGMLVLWAGVVNSEMKSVMAYAFMAVRGWTKLSG
ncbi:unnamed protein product [Prunus armeniaca]